MSIWLNEASNNPGLTLNVKTGQDGSKVINCKISHFFRNCQLYQKLLPMTNSRQNSTFSGIQIDFMPVQIPPMSPRNKLINGYGVLLLAGINTLFSIITFGSRNFFPLGNDVKKDFRNMPMSIFGGGIICAVLAWCAGGMALSKQGSNTINTGYYCYVFYVCGGRFCNNFDV